MEITVKVFISLPMNGIKDEDVKIVIESVKQKVVEHFPNESIEFIDSFFEGAPTNANPLWYLSKSIELLSQADVAVFAPGWNCARGCRIEHECASRYGIQCVYVGSSVL